MNEVKTFLGKKIRVLICDGRLIEGEFQCMDKDLNFVLGSAIEYFSVDESEILQYYMQLIIIYHKNSTFFKN
jgi:small nuclear ribonucleoprotein (snRNP)-like protein